MNGKSEKVSKKSISYPVAKLCFFQKKNFFGVVGFLDTIVGLHWSQFSNVQNNWPKWAKIKFMRKINFWSLGCFGGFWDFGAFQGPAEGQKRGSVGVWHTGQFAIYHSIDSSLQETFPVNQLI